MTAIPSACKQTPAGLHVAAAGAATADGRVMTLARYLLDSLRSLWLSPYPAASLNPEACCINAGKASTQGLLASSCPAASSSQGPAPGKPPPPSGPLDIPTPLPRQRSQRSQRAAAADPDAGADGRQAAALGLEGRCGAGWPHQGVQAAAAAAAGEAAAAAPEGEDNRAVAQVLARMQQLLQVTSLLEVKVRAEACQAAQLLRGADSHECPVPQFTLALGSQVARLGCRTYLRRACDARQYWSKSLRKTFALCLLPGASGRPVAVICDPNFREHFRCSHMTPRYRAVWQALPSVFVGQATQLVLVTQLMCAELALKFESEGLVVPPWRMPKACISRWLSNSNTDLAVPMEGPCKPPTAVQATQFLAAGQRLASAQPPVSGSKLGGVGTAEAASPTRVGVIVRGFEVAAPRCHNMIAGAVA